MDTTSPGHELMELSVGGSSREELRAALERDGVGLNAYAEELLGRAELESPARTLSLVTVTARELGFPEGAAFREVFTTALDHGLELCPLATGPHLRLALHEAASSDPELRRHRPPEGALHVASPVLDPAFDVPKGFYLRTVEGGRWLRGYLCDEDYHVPPDDQLCFRAGHRGRVLNGQSVDRQRRRPCRRGELAGPKRAMSVVMGIFLRLADR